MLLHVLGTQTYLHIARAPDDLRLVAASLANDAAEHLDDPVSLGVAAFGLSNVLLASGAFALADDIVRRAEVTPGIDAELAGMLALSTSEPPGWLKPTEVLNKFLVEAGDALSA